MYILWNLVRTVPYFRILKNEWQKYTFILEQIIWMGNETGNHLQDDTNRYGITYQDI